MNLLLSKPPTLSSDALQGLSDLNENDLGRFKAAVGVGNQIGWGYYFPYLLARSKPTSRVLIHEDQGSVCLFLLRKKRSVEKLDILLAPTPMNPSVLRRCIERANDFNRNFGASVMRIDEKDAPAVGELAHVNLKPRRAQYMYAPVDLGDISGRRFRTLRRNIALVEKLTDVQVVALGNDHLADCRTLLDDWGRQHHERFGTSGGVSTSARALDFLGLLPNRDLHGEAVYIDGQMCGYSLGGEISPSTGCYFDVKNNFEFNGLSYYLRRSYLAGQQPNVLINDGSDTNRVGLKQLKDSLRPTGMHIEYRAVQD